MRVLMTALHIHPMIPLAQALQAAGHEVAIAASKQDRMTIEKIGIRCFPAGANMASLMPNLMPQIMQLPAEQRDLWVIEHVFAGLLPEQMIPDLLAICRQWRPDVIVRDATEMGGCIAAEYLGLPHASVEVGVFIPAAGEHPLAKAINRSANRVRARYGLPQDPSLEMLYRYLHLSFVPPSYQDPAVPLPPTAHTLRTTPFDRSGDETLPGWVAGLPAQPTVYATLGLAIFNRTPGIFPAILKGLAGEPINVILTVGRGNDPAAYGAPPSNVHIEPYIPQTLLLPHCAAVIAHGGWNTVLAALSYGLPLLVIPIGADQPQNAQRVQMLGVGLVLDLSNLTPEAVREATWELLRTPHYRQNARRIQAEIAALPGPEYAVELLEQLASEKQPVLGELVQIALA
jgi:UDP:flavonoid glycosyltransferase YjiC (YdhE family)